MKKLMLVGLSLLTNLIVAQQITFEDVKSGGDIKGKYTSYIASDGFVYDVGKNIDLGIGSGNNGIFTTITCIDIMGNILPVPSNAMNRSFEIKSMRVTGSTRQGYKMNIISKGIIGTYVIIVEDGISVGEIKSKGMTSDKAMIELKKAKDKLDLGVITQEEYDKIKIELLKYIK